MKQQKPFISIIMPVQNAGSTLQNSLKSLLSQTHRNFEIIVIDDFSRDNSFDILKSFRKKDKRLRVFRNKKRYGLALTLNRAIKRAKAEYIAFAGSDGVNASKRLQKQIEYLLENPKVAAVGTQCVFLSEKNKKMGTSEFPEEHDLITKTLLPCHSIQPETVMINRTILPKDILYFKKNSYPFIYSDVFMKFLSYARLANLPKALYYHRKSDSLATRTSQAKYFLKMGKLWVKSLTEYEHRSSLRSILMPLIKQAS